MIKTHDRTVSINLATLELLIESARTKQAKLRQEMDEITARVDTALYLRATGMIQGRLDGLSDHLDDLLALQKESAEIQKAQQAVHLAARYEKKASEHQETTLFDKSI